MGSDQQSETAERRRRRLTISSAGVAEGSEAGLGSGEEAFDEAGLVLHSAEPGLYRCGELGDVTLGAAGARCCRRLPSPPGSGRDGPRCGPSAVLNPARTRLRRPARRLLSDRSFMTGHVRCLQAAMAASSRSAVRRAGTCTLHPIRRSSRSTPACVYSTRNLRRTRSATGPRSSTGPHPIPDGRAGVEGRLQLGQLGRGELAFSPAGPFGGQRLPARRPPAPAATGSPTSAIPGTSERLPGRWPRPRSAPLPQAATAPADVLRSGQPAAIGIPHDTGMPRSASDDQRP
jgi:hypothetical protein